jgi:hypothetical protein
MGWGGDFHLPHLNPLQRRRFGGRWFSSSAFGGAHCIWLDVRGGGSQDSEQKLILLGW